MLFHIVAAERWRQAVADGRYAPESLADEGFVHCSFAPQVAATARRWYAGIPDLVVVEFDPSGLDVRVEEVRPGEAFPHVYGPIPASAAVAVHPLSAFRDGAAPASRGR